jgi:hypothetical protein
LRPQQVFRSVGLRGFPATRRSFRRRPAGSARDEPLPYWKTDAMQSLFHSTDRSCKSGRLDLRSSMPSDEEAVRRPPPSAVRMRGGNRPRGYTVEASCDASTAVILGRALRRLDVAASTSRASPPTPPAPGSSSKCAIWS